MIASGGAYSYKSVTTMFQNFSVKTFMILMFVLTLSACASIGKHHEVAAQRSLIATSMPDLQPLPINIEPVELAAVIPEVKDLPVALTELHERARVVMSEEEITCMAKAIYFEARGEGSQGQIGVGYVVLNRMADKRFKSSTACGVVYQRSNRGCQFSWVCDGKPDTIRSAQSYQVAREVAIQVMTRSVANPVDDSLYFRHRNVASKVTKQKFRAMIGAHRFYAAI